MSDQKISELTALTGANVADTDLLPIVDTSATETKKITFGEFKTALDTATGFVRITGDTMTGALDVQSTITADGLTVDGNNSYTANLKLYYGDAAPSYYANLGYKNDGNNVYLSIADGGSSKNILKASWGGDISFYAADGTTPSFVYDESAGLTINEAGADRDFRVESDTNANALFVQGSDGNVGIGTSLPTAKIHATTATAGYAAKLINTNGASDSNGLLIQAGTGASEYNLNLTNTAGTTNFLVVKGNGNVGIGTSSPTHKLTVGGYSNVNAANKLAIGDNAGYQALIYMESANETLTIENTSDYAGRATIFKDNGTERMRINSSGGLITNPAAGGHAVFNEGGVDADFRVESDTNTHALFVDASANAVGIGTSTTDGKLKISATSGGGDAAELTLYGNNGAVYGYGNVVRSKIASQSAGDAFGANLLFYTNDSSNAYQERMSIDSLGGLITKPAAGGHAVFNENSVDADFRVESDTNTHALFVDAGSHQVAIGTSDLNTDSDPALLTIQSRASSNHAIHINSTSADGVNGGGFFTSSQKDDKSTGWTTLGFWDNGSTRQVYYGGGGWGGEEATNHVFYAGNYDAGIGGAPERFRINTTECVFNDSGLDVDFRVESDTNTHALFVDAGTSRVGIGTSSLDAELSVYASDASSYMKFTNVNNPSSGVDFGLYDNGSSSAQAVIINREAGGEIALQDNIGTLLTLSATEAKFNDESRNIDFRVESDSNANMLTVDASVNVLGIGKLGSGSTTKGAYFNDSAPNFFHFVITHTATEASHSLMFLNRQSSDGQLIDFRQADSLEGSISVSGSTVTYTGFSGRHESSGIPANTPVGTVVSTINELDVYPATQADTDGGVMPSPKAGQTRADHAQVEVSTSEGDSCVYGVVSEFDSNGKLIVTSVGIGSIRVTGACSKGDLLESNGDGTAKVQSDDIVRSKTIGKVTIGNSDTGVKLVSCVMYCG